MRGMKLFWWTFGCLSISMTLGVLIFSYYQFQIYHRLESLSQSERLKEYGNLSRRVITAQFQRIKKSRSAGNDICRDLALRSRSRVTLITEEGIVLGDSLYGSNYRVDEMTLSQEYSTKFDPSTGGEIMSHSTLISGPEGMKKVYLRLSRPIIGDREKIKIFFQESGLAVLSFVCLIILCSAIISSKIDGAISRVVTSVIKFQSGDLRHRIPSSEFMEIQYLGDALTRMAETLKNNREILQQNMNQWEGIFASMREGVLVLDYDYKLRILNDAAIEYLGLTARRDYLGVSLLDVIRHPELNAIIRSLSEGDQYEESDIEIDTGDKSYYVISGTRLKVNPEQPMGYLLVLRDITRIRKLERVRKDFVANVSHELKTPITVIKGVVESLSDCIQDDPARAANFVDTIDRNTDRINRIIDDLLCLANLEQDDSQSRDEFYSRGIAETVADAVAACKTTLSQKEIEVKIKIEDEVILGNHRLLEQALSNLIDNAAKYSKRNSIISLESRIVDNSLELRVQDAGIGIAASHQRRIFQRFYRADSSRDRSTGGSGLGLAIAKHIIQVHGGTIGVESTPGKGSCFFVRLPIAVDDPRIDQPVLSA